MARIHILPPATARLIAAGEVIDRPASALRELLDNAIDSGASEIQAAIESGGIASMVVSDDGEGISAEDLPLAVREHATSKISEADDLLRAKTLGFRGEALASIAAAARLEIVSRREDEASGSRLAVSPGEAVSLQPAAARKGTTVRVAGLFERYPARRQFLKRPQAEAALCRQVFNERAMAHPGIAFRWSSGAEQEVFPASTPVLRTLAIYPELKSAMLESVTIAGPGFGCLVIFAEPAFTRRDRRHLQVYVNRRRVPEWGLMSALEYAYAPWLPGGMKPCAFLFAEIDPAEADFNIHPAKREVRLKNPERVKAALLSGLRDALSSRVGAAGTDFGGHGERSAPAFPEVISARESPERAYAAPPRQVDWDRVAREFPRASTALPTDAEKPASEPFRYLGQAFGPFLVFEMDEALYILDQHAAHERILYDRLAGSGGGSQALLVPLLMDDLGPAASAALEAALPRLEAAGYALERAGTAWAVTAVPSLLGEGAVEAIAELLETGGEIPGEKVLATIACRAAVKDGDSLDPAAATDLIARSLALPVPRCPHGRPIWVRLDRERLYRMVGRITQ